jgi:hypothetical protein
MKGPQYVSEHTVLIFASSSLARSVDSKRNLDTSQSMGHEETLPATFAVAQGSIFTRLREFVVVGLYVIGGTILLSISVQCSHSFFFFDLVQELLGHYSTNRTIFAPKWDHCSGVGVLSSSVGGAVFQRCVQSETPYLKRLLPSTDVVVQPSAPCYDKSHVWSGNRSCPCGWALLGWC